MEVDQLETSSRKTIVEKDEFYIEELVEMEKEFEDELFFECDEADLAQFHRHRAEKVAKIKTVGKILAHMDNVDETFNDAHAEGAANMIRGMATYIADTADIPTYVKTSQRTVVEQEVFQTFATKHYEDVNLRELVFDAQTVKLVKEACPIARAQSAKQREEERKKRAEEQAAKDAEAEKKKREQEAASKAEEDGKKKKKVIDQAYLNNLRAMKVVIPGPSRVNVPEPFRGDVPIGRERSSGLTSTRSSPYSAGVTSRSPYSTTSRAGSSTSSISSRFSAGSSIASKYSTTSKYSTASRYSSTSKY